MEDYICDRCNGKAYEIMLEQNRIVCEKCLGNGKLNWIENIFGKTEEFGSKELADLVRELIRETKSEE